MKDLLKRLDVKILILSRSRFNSITTNKLLPNFVEILVPETQKSDYEKAVENPIIAIPDEIKGLGEVRNWVLDHFKERIVIMIDDDIKYVYRLTGAKSERVEDKDEVLDIIVNTAVMADDAGAKVFGFDQRDIRKFNGAEPFSLCGWLGCVIGVIGREHKFRSDKYKVDIDFCMKCLLTDRIIWEDNRYFFSQSRDDNVGGNSEFRTAKDFEKSLNSLQKKWGKYLIVGMHKNQIRIRTNVQRKQRLKYE